MPGVNLLLLISHHLHFIKTYLFYHICFLFSMKNTSIFLPFPMVFFVLPAKKDCRKMYDSYKTESVCRGISVIPRQLLQQPPCYCLQLFLWLRKGLAPFYTVRFCVAFFHKQTFLRAGWHTASALYTVKPVNGPCSGLPVHRDSTGRAGTHTKAAGNAVFNLNAHMPPHPFRIIRRFKGILCCGRFPEQIL